MPERGCFIYADDTNKMMVSFEKRRPGVPVETLIPETALGAAFAKFELSKYFALADMVLIPPQEWIAFCKTLNWTGVTKTQPKTVHCPSPNLDYLKLRRGSGMDQARVAEIFTIAAAYWSAQPNIMALEPGLVASLWRGGMRADMILKYIRDFTGKDGKLHQPAGRGPDIMNAVCTVYQRAKGLPADQAMPQATVEQMIDIWMKATRSVEMNTPGAENAALHWADYRRLGLVDAAGRADLQQVIQLAEILFVREKCWTFDDAVAWADGLIKATSHPNTNALRSKLKKKRKQGRVNRKRGR